MRKDASFAVSACSKLFLLVPHATCNYRPGVEHFENIVSTFNEPSANIHGTDPLGDSKIRNAYHGVYLAITATAEQKRVRGRDMYCRSERNYIVKRKKKNAELCSVIVGNLSMLRHLRYLRERRCCSYLAIN